MAKLSPVNLSSTFNSFRVKFNRMIDSVGDIASLNTDDNTTVVAAINTLDSNQGTRTSLTTNVTTDLVSAINSLDSNIGNLTLLNTPETADIVTAINSMLDSGEAQSMIDSSLADSSVISNIANRSIANSKLTNNSITINGINFALGDDKGLDTTDSDVQIGLVKSTMRVDSDTGIHIDSDASPTGIRFSLDKIPNSSLINPTFSVNGDSAQLGSNITVDIVDSAAIISLVRDSAVSVTDAGGDGSLSYNSGTGVFTYTGPSASEVRAHFSAGDGIDLASGVISVGTGEVTNDMLAGSIANSKLVNSSITVNGSGVSLGGSVNIDAIDSARTQAMIDSNFGDMPASISVPADFTINGSNSLVANTGTFYLQDGAGNNEFVISGNNISSYNSSTFSADGPLKLDTSSDLYFDTATGIIYWQNNAGYGDFAINAKFDIATEDTLKIYTGMSTLNTTFTDDNITVEGDVTSLSDERTKENIETISEGLEIVDALRGVYYNKIGKVERKVGVIAQEVETVLPEVVKTDAEGMKSVDYGKMIGVLIEAIKDLKHEIEDLKRGL